MTTVICRFVSVDSQPGGGIARIQVKTAHPGVDGMVVPSCMEAPIKNGVARFEGVQPGQAEITITPPTSQHCHSYASWQVTIPDTEEITLVELVAGGDWEPPQVTQLQASLAEARELLAGLPDGDTLGAQIKAVTGRVDELEGKVEALASTPPAPAQPGETVDEWEEHTFTELKIYDREPTTHDWLTGEIKLGISDAHIFVHASVKLQDESYLAPEHSDPSGRLGGKYLGVLIETDSIKDKLGFWFGDVEESYVWGPEKAILQPGHNHLLFLLPVSTYTDWLKGWDVRFVFPRLKHNMYQLWVG